MCVYVSVSASDRKEVHIYDSDEDVCAIHPVPMRYLNALLAPLLLLLLLLVLVNQLLFANNII